MWIEAQDHSLINLSTVKSIHIELTEKEEYAVWADGDNDLLGIYPNAEKAVIAYRGIINALRDRIAVYSMPNNKCSEE